MKKLFVLFTLAFCISPSAWSLTEDEFIRKILKSDVIILGETHPNPINSLTLQRLVEKIELRRPGVIAVVALESYRSYQTLVNSYLTTGDTQILLSSPDDDVLRGHHQDAVIKRNFLSIFEQIFALNQRRAAFGCPWFCRRLSPIEILMMDRLPDESMSMTQWKKTHSELELMLWAATRDEGMLERLKPKILKAKEQGKKTIVFVGNMHLMKSAEMINRIPQMNFELRVSWLGRRMREEFPDVVTILQSNNHPLLIDRIEATLREQGVGHTQYIEIAKSPFAQILQKDLYVSTDIPPIVQVSYSPETSNVGENYDYYIFYPKTLVYKP